MQDVEYAAHRLACPQAGEVTAEVVAQGEPGDREDVVDDVGEGGPSDEGETKE